MRRFLECNRILGQEIAVYIFVETGSGCAGFDCNAGGNDIAFELAGCAVDFEICFANVDCLVCFSHLLVIEYEFAAAGVVGKVQPLAVAQIAVNLDGADVSAAKRGFNIGQAAVLHSGIDNHGVAVVELAVALVGGTGGEFENAAVGYFTSVIKRAILSHSHFGVGPAGVGVDIDSSVVHDCQLLVFFDSQSIDLGQGEFDSGSDRRFAAGINSIMIACTWRLQRCVDRRSQFSRQRQTSFSHKPGSQQQFSPPDICSHNAPLCPTLSQ